LLVNAPLGGGQPAGGLAERDLRVVRGDAVRDLWEGEVSGDVVKQKLAEPSADFHFFIGPQVGECIYDNLSVVFVDDAVACVVGREDYREPRRVIRARMKGGR